MPVYNAGEFLEPAIQSVLSQQFSDFELIIVDDDSLERPDDVVSGFDDRRIRYFQNGANLGLPANWNRCLDYCRGEYITIFHQDDLMLPGNLSTKCALLDNDPDVGLVYSDIVSIDENGATIGGHYIEQPTENLIMSGSRLYRMIAETGNPIACPTVIMRSECYERLGVYDTSLSYATDMEMWLRVAAHYDIGFIAQPLVAHRRHKGQEGDRFRLTGRDYQETLWALDRAFAHDVGNDCRVHRSDCYRTLSRQAIPMARWRFRDGDLRAAMRYASVALVGYLNSLSK